MASISEEVVNITRKVISEEKEESIERGMAKLLYNETRRKLIEYELLDRNLTKKYGMSFDEFSGKENDREVGIFMGSGKGLSELGNSKGWN